MQKLAAENRAVRSGSDMTGRPVRLSPGFRKPKRQLQECKRRRIGAPGRRVCQVSADFARRGAVPFLLFDADPTGGNLLGGKNINGLTH
jgi:hypothetical protein